MSTQTPFESRSRRRRSLVVAIAVLMMMIAGACSSGFGEDAATQATSASSADFGEDSDAAFDTYDAEAPMVEAEMADDLSFGSDGEAASRANLTGAAGSEATAQLPDLGRDIIFTATLDLAATDVSNATRQAIRAIEGRGGFLFSQDTSGGSSVLTFKVLPEQFHAALNDLGSVGTVRAQSISADDVSAVVVDLESRINTAEASVIRLRDLLDNASELETIATLENQLLQRETTLEQLRGQLRTVRNQVDLATITVFVTELLNRPSIALESVAYAGHDAGFGCFDGAAIRVTEAGDPITICYRLTNTGDTPLIDLRLDDPALGASIGSLVIVDGTTTQIEPGESVLLAHETELLEQVRVRTSVTATGIDADGNPIDREVKSTAATIRFEVLNVDDGFPTFGEVLGNSWNALVTVAIVLALVAVAIAPFVAVALMLGMPTWWFVRRVRAQRPPSAITERPPAPPAPPADGASDSPDTTSDAKATTTA